MPLIQTLSQQICISSRIPRQKKHRPNTSESTGKLRPVNLSCSFCMMFFRNVVYMQREPLDDLNEFQIEVASGDAI